MIKRKDLLQTDDAPARLTLMQPARSNARLVALVMLTGLGFAAFWLGVRLHAPRSMTPRPAPRPDVIARFFDTGQGCSLLLIAPERRAVLIDAGTTLTDEGALKAEMRREGIGSLSAVVLTSCRAQAIGGLPHLLSTVAVRGPILIPVPLDQFQAQGGRAAELCREAISRHGLTLQPSPDYLDAHSDLLGANTSLTSHLISGDPAEADVVRFQEGRAALVYLGNVTHREEESALSLRGELACDTLVISADDAESAVDHELLALSSAQTIIVPLPSGSEPTHQTIAGLSASDARIVLMNQATPVELGLSAQSDTAQVLAGKKSATN